MRFTSGCLATVVILGACHLVLPFQSREHATDSGQVQDGKGQDGPAQDGPGLDQPWNADGIPDQPGALDVPGRTDVLQAADKNIDQAYPVDTGQAVEGGACIAKCCNHAAWKCTGMMGGCGGLCSSNVASMTCDSAGNCQCTIGTAGTNTCTVSPNTASTCEMCKEAVQKNCCKL